MDKEDLAYAAGVFDGEGCVSFRKRLEHRKGKKKAYEYWLIRCEMSMTDYHVMKWFHNLVKVGTLTKRLPTKSWVGKKTQWRWRCSHRDALIFSKLIWPWAQVKAEKIEQIINHYDEKDNVVWHPNDNIHSAKVINLKEERIKRGLK
jgi:hypothetical protein|tara:strand:- start:449 stop:889 length:441 start_codon:yes stop_codon:yes gene_type:complete